MRRYWVAFLEWLGWTALWSLVAIDLYLIWLLYERLEWLV